jgi:hypothetical protein
MYNRGFNCKNAEVVRKEEISVKDGTLNLTTQKKMK